MKLFDKLAIGFLRHQLKQEEVALMEKAKANPDDEGASIALHECQSAIREIEDAIDKEIEKRNRLRDPPSRFTLSANNSKTKPEDN
jgi:hypothetical protein